MENGAQAFHVPQANCPNKINWEDWMLLHYHATQESIQYEMMQANCPNEVTRADWYPFELNMALVVN